MDFLNALTVTLAVELTSLWQKLSRYDSLLINRLRVGHCHLTHSYLLSGDNLPTCEFCGLSLMVEPVLLDCTNFPETREKYYAVSSFRELFEIVDNDTVIDFIKETHFYRKLFYISSIALILHYFFTICYLTAFVIYYIMLLSSTVDGTE